MERHKDQLVWGAIFGNTNATHLLDMSKLNELNTPFISQNTSEWAMDWLESHSEGIVWELLSQNPNPRAIRLLERHAKASDVMEIYAVSYLKQHPDQICWSVIDTKEAIAYMELHPERICWKSLSKNKSKWAVNLLRENPDKIDWVSLSGNSGEEAFQLLMEHPEKVDWLALSGNASNGAVEFWREHLDRIDWTRASMNPRILDILL